MPTLRLTTRCLAMLTLIALSFGGIVARGAPPVPMAAPPTAAPATNSLGENIDLVQNLGGPIDDLLKSGDRLYLLTGRDLITVDVANPASPSTLGRAALPMLPGAVAAAGDYLYVHPNWDVTPTEQPLSIIDVRDPLHPRLAGKYVDGSANLRNRPRVLDMVAAGPYVYRLLAEWLPAIGYDYWMDIVDVSDPANPAQVNLLRFPMGHTLRTMDLDGGRMVIGYDSGADNYNNTGTNGALIVDVSNPAADLSDKTWNVSAEISVVARLVALHADAGRLTLSFDDASIAWGNRAFFMFDISDPAHATRIGSIVGGAADPLTTIMVGADGTRGLFAAEGAQFGLKLTDLTTPAAPTLLGSLTFGPAAHVRSLWQDGLAYLLGQEASGATILHIVDIQNPAAPLERGRLTVSPFQKVNAVIEQDGIAYLLAPADYSLHAQGNRGTLLGYDVSDPARPAELSRLVLPLMPDRAFIEDGYLYVEGSGDTRMIVVIDVRDPGAPAIASTYTTLLHPISTFRLLGVKDRLAYVNDNVHDLKVINFANLAAPQVVATIDARPTSLAFSGTIAWFLEYSTDPEGTRLFGLDMANPAAPQEVGALLTTSIYADYDALVIGGRYAYIWAVGHRLHLIDLADPAQPREVLVYQLDNPSANSGFDNARSLVLDGGYLYARTSRDLRVVDVSRPLQPRAVASASGIVDGYALDARARMIFLPNENGLSILRNRAGSVAGVVRQANRQPFAGARLDLSTGLTATSDLAGSYRFQDLPRATVSVTPTLAGYAFWPPHRSASLPPNASADFVITARPATVALSPAGPVRLVITDTQGLPAAFDFAASPAPSATVTPTPLLHQAPFGQTFAGHAFTLAPATLSATVTIAFSAADTRLVSDVGGLALWRWNGQDWAPADCPGAAPAAPAGSVSLRLCAGGEYALLGPSHQLLMTRMHVR